MRDNARPCPVRGTSILSLHRAMSCFHDTSRWYRSYREGILESPSIVGGKLPSFAGGVTTARRCCLRRPRPFRDKVIYPHDSLRKGRDGNRAASCEAQGGIPPNIMPGWADVSVTLSTCFHVVFFLYREGIVGVALSIYREKNHRTRDYSRVSIRLERRPCRSFRNGRDSDHGFASVKRSIGRRACHHAIFSIQAGR